MDSSLPALWGLVKSRSRLVHAVFTAPQQLVGRAAGGCRSVEAAHRHDDLLGAEELEVRRSDGLVLAAGRPLTLSVRELSLLIALMERRDRIVSREELYRLAWDSSLRHGDRSVDVYVHKLRAKLEDALPQRRFIHTHFGFGYRFSVEPSHAFHKSATSE
jgi:DNA-binding response OmpR family regulator